MEKVPSNDIQSDIAIIGMSGPYPIILNDTNTKARPVAMKIVGSLIIFPLPPFMRFDI